MDLFTIGAQTKTVKDFLEWKQHEETFSTNHFFLNVVLSPEKAVSLRRHSKSTWFLCVYCKLYCAVRSKCSNRFIRFDPLCLIHSNCSVLLVHHNFKKANEQSWHSFVEERARVGQEEIN